MRRMTDSVKMLVRSLVFGMVFRLGYRRNRPFRAMTISQLQMTKGNTGSLKH